MNGTQENQLHQKLAQDATVHIGTELRKCLRCKYEFEPRTVDLKKKCRSGSGISGVFHERIELPRWSAHITINKKFIYLGQYKSKLDAAKARYNAEKKYGILDPCFKSTVLQYIEFCEIYDEEV